jgi:hypothetical protein
MLHLLRLTILIFLLILAGTGSAGATSSDRDTVAAVMKKAREDAKKMTGPANRFMGNGRQAASTFHSPEFQDRIRCERGRLEKEVFDQYITSWKKTGQQTAAKQGELEGSLEAGEKVYLFLSSSVPDETVRAYAGAVAGVAEPNIFLVMRGVVGGLESRKSVQYFSRILKKDPTCRDTQQRCPRYQVSIKIASNLFTRYGIDRVPAVVYSDGRSSFLIQGDAALDYLLERINREAGSESLADLIKKMRGRL